MVLFLGTLAVVTIIALVIAVAVLSGKINSDKPGTSGQQKPRDCQMSSASYILQHFGAKDGLHLRWFPAANDRADIDAALKDNVHFIEAFVIEDNGEFFLPNKDMSLAELLRTLASKDKGLKINGATNAPSAARLIDSILGSRIKTPVFVSVPVLSSSFNLTEFVLCESEHLPKNIIINFDITGNSCDTNIGLGTMEFIAELLNELDSYASVEISTGCVQESWETVRWLLSKNEQLALILSQNINVTNSSLFDALTIRNDIDKDLVFYNFDRTFYKEFVYVASTAGSALLYFNINPRDAGRILWSHNTDTWEQLNAATSGDIMMIEGDIQLKGQDTPNQTNVPVMGHDIGDFNNLTFEQWLDEIIKVNKGMKFDFKTIDAVKPALQIVRLKRSEVKGPVWLNADILKGPNAKTPRIPKDEFLATIQEEFPEATLSLGWTTVAKGTSYHLNYTMAMVQEMHNFCKNLRQPITFPVRAEQVVDSWDALDWLLKQSRAYTLTVWTGAGDNVTRSDMMYIKRQAEVARVYFDLPEQLRPYFP